MLCTAEKVSAFGAKAVRSAFPFEGKPKKMFAAGRLTVRALICPRCAACTESFPPIPHAVVVSLPTAGVKGASPLQLFLFEFFFLRRKKNGEATTQS